MEIFEVKVPINFLGTQGFSLRREGRYISEENVSVEKYLSHPVIFVLLGVVKPRFKIV